MKSDKAFFHIIFEMYTVRSMYTFVVLSDSSICKNTDDLQTLVSLQEHWWSADSRICKNTTNLQLLGGGGGGGGGTTTVQNLESKLVLQISGTDHEFNKLEVVTKLLD
jgi:hypothetical protein